MSCICVGHDQYDSLNHEHFSKQGCLDCGMVWQLCILANTAALIVILLCCQNYVLELFDRMMRNSAVEGYVDFSSFQRAIQQWVEAVKRQSRYTSLILMLYYDLFNSVSPTPRSDSSLSISQMSEVSKEGNVIIIHCLVCDQSSHSEAVDFDNPVMPHTGNYSSCITYFTGCC